jgi:hypothetical protein
MSQLYVDLYISNIETRLDIYKLRQSWDIRLGTEGVQNFTEVTMCFADGYENWWYLFFYRSCSFLFSIVFRAEIDTSSKSLFSGLVHSIFTMVSVGRWLHLHGTMYRVTSSRDVSASRVDDTIDDTIREEVGGLAFIVPIVKTRCRGAPWRTIPWNLH